MTNEVLLEGRLSRQPEERVLPSGDTLWLLRVVVPRTETDPPGVDWMDCAVWSGRLRRSVAGWSSGDLVRIEGSLRRRFYRSGGAPVSRVEVVATRGRRLSRSPSA